jgi:hypothetical protein
MSSKMNALLDGLEDESSPSLGKEIGDVLSTALQTIGQGQESQAKQTARIIEVVEEKLTKVASELTRAANKSSPIAPPIPEAITVWHFDVERDEDNLITRITATAGAL